jgi:hypothetical protein
LRSDKEILPPSFARLTDIKPTLNFWVIDMIEVLL